jgi:hypothetical protein
MVTGVGRWLDALSWTAVAVACLTLGLAPFYPVPHVAEKVGMLARGDLHRPIDWFDLVLHGSPWALAALKGGRGLSRRRRPSW